MLFTLLGQDLTACLAPCEPSDAGREGLLRLIGVWAGGNSTLIAADGHRAASAEIACADAVGSTTSFCSSNFGYVCSNSDGAATA